MKVDINQNEIEKLEKVLSEFRDEWEILQTQRATKWRLHFFISFIVALLASLMITQLWWLGIVVIGYFAGSLFSMLRLNAKTSTQIIEHQKQLKLVRLLRNFHSSPYSKE